MDILQKTLQICKENNIKPARSKGQNFLINEDIYNEIISAADLKKNDMVMEVGPGLGFLTRKLAEKAKKVIAVELDDNLAEILKDSLKEEKINNVEIINENILDFDLPFSEKYKIVANLPYNISSVFLRKFLEKEKSPETMVLMLQREVAERITASAGDMSKLSVSVQYYAIPEIVKSVPREDFWPSPEVDSAVVRLKINNKLRSEESKSKDFFRLVRHGFSSRRKMLKNNMAGGLHISQKEAGEVIKKAGFNEKIRAQELSVDDWKKLLGHMEEEKIIK